MGTDKTGLRDTKTGITRDYPRFEDKSPLILSDWPWKPPKTLGKDKVEVTIDEIWSEMRAEGMGRPFYVYAVESVSKGHSYSCELFEGVKGEPCGRCNCPSSIPCKHLIHSIKDLLQRHPEFGEAESLSDFMVGIGELDL